MAYNKRRTKPVKDRILARMKVEDRGYLTPCYIWLGEVDRDNYGRIKDNGRYVPTHHVFMGKPPGENLTVNHECLQRACFRPSHLTWMTLADNLKEMHQRRREAKEKDDV